MILHIHLYMPFHPCVVLLLCHQHNLPALNNVGYQCIDAGWSNCVSNWVQHASPTPCSRLQRGNSGGNWLYSYLNCNYTKCNNIQHRPISFLTCHFSSSLYYDVSFFGRFGVSHGACSSRPYSEFHSFWSRGFTLKLSHASVAFIQEDRLVAVLLIHYSNSLFPDVQVLQYPFLNPPLGVPHLPEKDYS